MDIKHYTLHKTSSFDDIFETYIVTCKCGDSSHQIELSIDTEFDDAEISFSINEESVPFWKRIKKAVSLIFTGKYSYCHDMIIQKEDLEILFTLAAAAKGND